MADFSHIQSIQTVLVPQQSNACDAVSGSNFLTPNASKASLQLRVAGSSELLTITCSCLDVAESMADLIDGYCRLVNQSSTSIWHRKGKDQIPSSKITYPNKCNDTAHVVMCYSIVVYKIKECINGLCRM